MTINTTYTNSQEVLIKNKKYILYILYFIYILWYKGVGRE